MKKFIIMIFSLSLCLQGIAQESSCAMRDTNYKKLMHQMEVKKQTKKRLKKYAATAVFIALIVAGAILSAYKKKEKNKSSDSVGLFIDLGMKTDSKQTSKG